MGLQQLHDMSILHCDLKGTNILVDGLVPQIADFGISRVCVQSGTLADSTHTAGVGTYEWMAPELSAFLPASAKSLTFMLWEWCF
jgi:serine/threonine protein kinase